MTHMPPPSDLAVPPVSSPDSRRFGTGLATPGAPPRIPVGDMARAAAAAHAMAPGTYLRLRREKAGVSIEELALVLSDTPGDRAGRIEWLTALETAPDHRTPIAQPLLDRMASFLDMDVPIYLALVGFAQDPDSGLPCPRICTGCGCTWNRACLDTGKLGPCHWRNDGNDRCSTCPPEGES